MKCIICYKEAEVTFQANTFCKEHFEKVWAYLNGDRIMGRNILQLKQEFVKGVKK